MLGPMAASHVRAEEFSKVCQLEFYLAFFLNEEALAVPNNNCEINHSRYFFPYAQLLKYFFTSSLVVFFSCDQL